MVFSIIIILFIGIIAFFHYVQGFFSATISAMICILAAVLAVSYDETVVNLLLKGKMADMAHGMVLCIIFAVVYMVLRVIFDMAVPGNVRVPATVDKAGAILMGIIAGIFTTGIFAIAVQTLPFDPGISFMGYSRYTLRDTPLVQVPMLGQFQDSHISGEMEDTSLAPDKEKGMLVPVDDWVMDAVYHLSNGGSLAGDRTLESVHPDYLQELFGQRLGIQTGARHAALQFESHSVIDITDVYTVPTLPVMDGQNKELRPSGYTPPFKDVVKPSADQRLLVVRIKANSGATDDDDHVFRFSCGSIHIVGKAGDGYKDFYPIGTLENARTLLLNKPDDFLFVTEGNSFDAVFLVDQSLLTGKTKIQVSPETFISIKRFANIDLSDKVVKTSIPYDASVAVIRGAVLADRLKKVLPPPPAAGAAPAAAATPEAAPNTPAPPPVTPAPSADVPTTPTPAQPRPDAAISDTLTATASVGFMTSDTVSLGTTNTDADGQNALVAGGSMNLKGGLIAAAKVDPTNTLADLAQGPQQASKFFVPDNRTMIQVAIRPYDTSWSWINTLGATQLVDTNGNTYPPNGFYALAKSGSAHALLLRYDAIHSLSPLTAPDAAPEGTVYLIFLIPHDTDLKTLKIEDKQQSLGSAPVHVQ
jgi:hypothetical protein